MATNLLLRICALLILINCQWSVINYAVAQEIGLPFIRNYTPKEYKADPQVFSVLQDKQTDILYFGIIPGIVSYDGVNWQQIPTPNKTLAYSLSQDNNGRIYAVAIDNFGYLDNNVQGQTTYKSLKHLITDTTLSVGTVWSVKKTDQAMYFLSFDAIFEYLITPNKLNVFQADTNGQFRGDFVFDNTYYVRLSKKGLMKIENSKLLPAPQSDFFKNKNNINQGVIPFQKNTLLVATRTEGVYIFDIKNNTPPQPFKLQNTDFLTTNSIYSAYSINENQFAFGSLKKGVLLIDAQGNTLQQYNEGNLLQNSGLLTIRSDKNQNLWFGTNNGISKTEHSQDMSYWDKNNGLKGSVANIIRFQNTLYIASQQNVYFLDENNHPQEIKEIPVGQNWRFLKFQTPSNETKLLIGTQHGIYEIDKRTAKQIHEGDHAFNLHQSRSNPNRLFSTDGTSDMISLLYQNGNWKSEGKWSGIKDLIYQFVEDKNGNIWLGTYSNGIIRITPVDTNLTGLNTSPFGMKYSVRYYTQKEGLPVLNDCAPFWFKNNLIWGTEKGLYAYNPATDKFEPFCDLGQQFCDGSKGIGRFQVLPDGRIYIEPRSNKTQDLGYLLPNAKGGYDWVYQAFRRLPEIASFESMYAEDNGVVWIGGSEGLFRYDASKDTRNYTQGFKCLVRQVRIGTDSVVFYGGGFIDTTGASSPTFAEFEYKYNNIKFNFAAPFFDREERTQYSFQLDGFDHDWSAWSHYTEKEYTYLSEGTYTFRVKAKNIYDVESEAGTYTFTVLPPYYRTWWAYTLYVILFLGLGVIILKYYTRSLVAQKEQLENIVNQRTAEVVKQKQEIEGKNAALEHKNAEIEEKNSMLERQNEQITSSIRYANKIQRAILPIQSQIDAYFENFILYRPKDIVSGDFYWFTVVEQDDKKMFFAAVVDCTGHGVPGAFMSMIGSRLLSEIVNERRIYETNEIADVMDSLILKSLQQQESDNNDGMDLSLCRLVPTADGIDLQYTGAKNVAYYFNSQINQLLTLNADRRSIGGVRSRKKEQPFSAQSYRLQKGDTLYLFSDGFIDQNNAERKRLGTTVFKEVIEQNHNLPMLQQQAILEKVLDEHRQSEEQRDDITVVGLRMV